MPFKLPEDPRHQRFAKIFLHTKVDLAGEPLTLQRAQGFIIERQQASGVAHQLFAFCRQRKMSALLNHQRRTALALQLLSWALTAEVERDRRSAASGETAALHAGHKAAQGVEIQPSVSVSPSSSPFSGRLS